MHTIIICVAYKPNIKPSKSKYVIINLDDNKEKILENKNAMNIGFVLPKVLSPYVGAYCKKLIGIIIDINIRI